VLAAAGVAAADATTVETTVRATSARTPRRYRFTTAHPGSGTDADAGAHEVTTLVAVNNVRERTFDMCRGRQWLPGLVLSDGYSRGALGPRFRLPTCVRSLLRRSRSHV
jgi:hypothetical protein